MQNTELELRQRIEALQVNTRLPKKQLYLWALYNYGRLQRSVLCTYAREASCFRGVVSFMHAVAIIDRFHCTPTCMGLMVQYITSSKCRRQQHLLDSHVVQPEVVRLNERIDGAVEITMHHL